MKRILAFLLALTMIFALCACESENKETATLKAATAFVSPVSEKYSVDLNCTKITPIKSYGMDAYVFNYSSEQFDNLSTEEKVGVFQALDELYIGKAAEYMDNKTKGFLELQSYLLDASGGTLPVTATWVYISSNGREYAVGSFGINIYTGEKSKEIEGYRLLNYSDLNESGDYLVKFDPEAKTCECLSLYHKFVAYEATGKGKTKCSACNGTGLIRYYYGGSSLEALLDGQPDSTVKKCYKCGGTGYTYD